MSRIVVNFSCGAASAVAAKIVVEAYAKTRDVQVIYLDTSKDEHPDNMRFLADVESWLGHPIQKLRNEKYSGIDDVFLTKRFIVGPVFAACTWELKRTVGERYMRPDDVIVLGFTADERDRIERYCERNPTRSALWVLAQANIHKADCYRIVQAAGIELPAMYRLGYNNSNCVGCIKGGMGYWNKIRRDFPEVFARRAMVEREVAADANNGGRPIILKDFFLDELPPDAGRDVPEPDIECGMFCSRYADWIADAAKQVSP